MKREGSLQLCPWVAWCGRHRRNHIWWNKIKALPKLQNADIFYSSPPIAVLLRWATCTHSHTHSHTHTHTHTHTHVSLYCSQYHLEVLLLDWLHLVCKAFRCSAYRLTEIIMSLPIQGSTIRMVWWPGASENVSGQFTCPVGPVHSLIIYVWFYALQTWTLFFIYIYYILKCNYSCDGKAKFSSSHYSSLQCHTVLQKSF